MSDPSRASEPPTPTGSDTDWARLLPPPSAPPTAVPGYEVLGELGRGGMGVVYKAVQTGLGRPVALKMILSGQYAGEEERRRFLTEAEAIARVRHPGIVQVYDFGTYDGRPYFSLEFCDGGSLADHLHGTPLPPRDAGRLVEQLAQAVQAAHDQGIVHRDLKPGNVLLQHDRTTKHTKDTKEEPTEDTISAASFRVCRVFRGETLLPKITDFGLAKRLEAAGQTQTGAVVGTPSYMAPEQARGEKTVGPPADVYALGAILYECLTGRPPFRAATPLDTVLQVIGDEPVPPRQLNAKTPRDLETICLKCLHKDPARRYASADALADDLRRFLDGRPIAARPVGPAERLWRWGRRHPALAALVAVCVVAAAALVGGGAWYNARLGTALGEARRQRDAARANLTVALDTVNTLLGEVGSDRLKNVPEMAPVRQALLEKALAFCEEIVARNDDDREARRQTAVAHQRVGDIYELLRQYDKAEAALDQAVALHRRLAQEFPDEPGHRRNLAEALGKLGAVYTHSHRLPRALEVAGEAREILEQLVADHPDVDAYQEQLASVSNNLGVGHAQTGNAGAALAAYENSKARYAALAARHPEARDRRAAVARISNNVGDTLVTLGRNPEAEAVLREAVATVGRAGPLAALTPDEWAVLAKCHQNLCYLNLRVGNPDKAAAEARQCVQVWEHAARQHPTVPTYRIEAARGYVLLGLSLQPRGPGPAKKTDKGEAVAETPLTAYEKARALLEPLREGGGNDPELLLVFGRTLSGLAWQYRQARQEAKAKEFYDQATPLLEGAVRAAPELVDAKLAMGQLGHELGMYHADRKQLADAEAAYGRARDLRGWLVQTYPDVPRYQDDLAWTHTNLGRVLGDLGRLPEAVAEVEQAVALRRGLASRHPLPVNQLEVVNACWTLGNLQERAGDMIKAEASYAEMAGVGEEVARKQPDNRGYVLAAGRNWNNLGALQLRAGKAMEAVESCSRAGKWLGPLVKAAPAYPNARAYLLASLRNTAIALGRVRDREALAAWDRALEAARDQDRPAVRLDRAMCVADLGGDHAKAAAEAEEVAAGSTDGELCYAVGVAFAACSRAVEKDDKLAPKEREALADRYATRAVELLRQAAKAGHFKDAGNRAELDRPPSLKHLKGRPEYEAFLKELGPAM